MIPWVRLAAVGAVLAGAAWGGWQVRDWQADSDDLAQTELQSGFMKLAPAVEQPPRF